MKEANENQVNESEIGAQEMPCKTVTSKPYFALYSCIVISIVLIITKSLALLGILILPLALFVMWKIPNKKQIEFFKDHCIVYPQKDTGEIKKIEYENIIEWIVKQGQQSGDYLLLRLANDEYIQIETFRGATIVKQFNSIIPEKEANRKKNSEMKNTAIKWPWGGKDKG